MKFINSAIFAVSCINLALSKAIGGEDKCNDQFCFWLTNEGSATILGFSQNNQNTKVLDIPASVNFDGRDYYVNAAGVGAFSGNENLEEVNVSSYIDNLYLDTDAFAYCSNLKKVVFNNKSVSAANTSSFASPNKDISFTGRGVSSYTNDQALKLITQWGFSVKNYNNESDYTRKEDLFNLAKYLTQYLRINEIKDSGNALVAIKVKFASYDGYARLFRIFAIAMGIPENYIYVASDGNNHYWNYCFIDNMWYNVDIINYPYRRYSLYSIAESQRPFYHGYTEFKEMNNDSIYASPSQWVVLFNNYGYPNELNGQQTSDNFDVFLNQHQLGYRA
eukprot:jgi/Orpsp1_1/1185427/evm.model.c7180000093702.1